MSASSGERKAWTELLAEAAVIASVVGGGGKMNRDDLARWGGACWRLKAAFPIPTANAQTCAKAFLLIARGFVPAGCPVASAAFLAAGAACLTAMLEAETRAAFQRSCRATGEG